MTTDEAQQRIGEPYQQAKAAIVRERDRLLAQRDALLEALQGTLEALENVAPKHLYKDGCFNWNHASGNTDDCPCIAHQDRAAIASVREATR